VPPLQPESIAISRQVIPVCADELVVSVRRLTQSVVQTESTVDECHSVPALRGADSE
jgi:hypothetical protein